MEGTHKKRLLWKIGVCVCVICQIFRVVLPAKIKMLCIIFSELWTFVSTIRLNVWPSKNSNGCQSLTASSRISYHILIFKYTWIHQVISSHPSQKSGTHARQTNCQLDLVLREPRLHSRCKTWSSWHVWIMYCLMWAEPPLCEPKSIIIKISH